MLEITPPTPSDGFGEIVAVAPLLNRVYVSNYVDSGGSVYNYEISSIDNTVSLFATITNFDGSNDGDDFGYSIATSSEYIIIGAPGVNGGEGAVYIYGIEFANYVGRIIEDGNDEQRFGFSVDISESIITIGAPEFGGSTGQVYVYNKIGFDRLAIISPEDFFTYFGWEVKAFEDKVIVGAILASLGKGAVYSYDSDGNQIDSAHGNTTGDYFGYSFASSGNNVIIGAPFTGFGSAYSLYIDSSTGEFSDLIEINTMSVEGSTLVSPSQLGYATASVGGALFATIDDIDFSEVWYIKDGSTFLLTSTPERCEKMAINENTVLLGGTGVAYYIRNWKLVA